MSNNWTTVNSHKASFNGFAESAFGRSSRNSEFNSNASSAFSNNRKQNAQPSVEPPVIQSRFQSALGPSEATAFGQKPTLERARDFGDGASSAFGKKSEESVGNNGFNEVAANAFGKKRTKDSHHEESDRPSIVIEKTNTLWALVSNVVPEVPKKREWSGSAIGQKKKKLEETAVASKKKDADITNMDLFPSLGSTVAPVSKSNSTLSFAEIMRRRKEQEEQEEAQELYRRQQEAKKRKGLENNTFVSLRINRENNASYNTEDEDDYNYDENDLDYVHHSERDKHGYYESTHDDSSSLSDLEDDFE